MKVGKKIGIGVIIVLGLFLLAAIIVPVLVDVDKYRPKIEEAAGAFLNGSVKLGKLKLSLWGRLVVDVDGFQLADSKGNTLVSAKDVYFHLPWVSLLTGSPELILKLTAPEINMVKNKQGKLNVLEVVKMDAEKGAETTPTEDKKTPASQDLPGIVRRARFGLVMSKAGVSFRDDKTALTSNIRDLNIEIKDMSLTRTMVARVWADLDTRMKDTLEVKGPIEMNFEATPHFKGTQFESARVSIDVEAGGLEIRSGNLFEKKKGVRLAFVAQGLVGMDAVDLSKCQLVFHNAELDLGVQVSHLKEKGDYIFHLKSNEIALKEWASLVPLLKEYELDGTASANFEGQGSMEVPQYKGQLMVSKLTLKSPQLKARPEVNLKVLVSTDKIQEFLVTLAAPMNDLKVAGIVQSFSKPKAIFAVTSSKLDLDALIDFPKPTKKPSGTPVASAPSEKSPKEGRGAEGKFATADLDASVEPLRKNAIVRGTVLTATYDLKAVKAYGVDMRNIAGSMSLKDLVAQFNLKSMKLWGGDLGAGFETDLKPKAPSYSLKASVNQLELKQAVESQLELFKNTLLGVASFSIQGAGSSFNAEGAKKNLNAKGSMKIRQATFASIDIGKMAVDAINRTVGEIGNKIPELKGKTIGAAPNVESKYEVISSDFSIAGGRFVAPNFEAKSEAGKGIDLKGHTEVGLIDYGLKANWELIDTHNLTKARDLSANIGGIEVPNILSDGGGPVKFPVVVGGSCFAPQVSYAAVPEAMIKVATNNMAKAAQERVKAEAKKRAEEEVKKLSEKAAPQVNEALQGLGKKLFGN